jgi:3-hydroxyacyl-[acyl-carrier-protein] dehydratase
MLWDRGKIISVLPQRDPFLFIDEVDEINGTDRVVAALNIKGSEPYFEGHFPGKPVVPGVLILEAMAQASIILFSLDRPDIAKTNPEYYLGKIKSEFLAPVYPGDRLIIESSKVKFLDYAAITDVIAKVKDNIAAKANLVFSIQQKNG